MSQPWRTGPKWFSQCAADPVTSTWNVDSAAIGKSKAVWFARSLQAALLIDLCLGFWGFGFPNDSPAVLFLFDQKERTLGMLLYAISVWPISTAVRLRHSQTLSNTDLSTHSISLVPHRKANRHNSHQRFTPIKRSTLVLQMQIKYEETGFWRVLELKKNKTFRTHSGNHFSGSKMSQI